MYQKNMGAQIPEPDQIKQFKEFLGTDNKLTEICFLDCVKTAQEILQEYHIQQNEALAAKVGLTGQP
ncbi:mitochondrial import inner membrane translocase subunit Tim9-like [Theropithecus gelada]|uniref:mitochondrial import inner membrane translocase subunit Tim9-like n=1 Tax=Theropithecus gelada TaxID=9565 RepID=UPI000DC1AD1F|nr:mitochondrial import inner membrane translocase subunit Tim9-like [Theropithecus gelada]